MDFSQLKLDIARVNKAFYDRIYRDPWMKDIFRNITQERIESQQTDFMLGAFGGPKLYAGRIPTDAHPHIFIDEEMWQLREKYLKEAFAETGFPAELAAKWLKIDEAFKSKIIKRSLADCSRRYTMDEIIYIPNPKKKAA